LGWNPEGINRHKELQDEIDNERKGSRGMEEISLKIRGFDDELLQRRSAKQLSLQNSKKRSRMSDEDEPEDADRYARMFGLQPSCQLQETRTTEV